MAKQTKPPTKKAVAKTIRKPRTRTKAIVPVTSQQTDPGSLVQLALEKGIEPDKLSQLLEIYQNWEALKAKKKYFNALSSFQAECPEIKKNKSSYNDRYKYAPLSSIVKQVKSYLEKHGFSFSFSENQRENGDMQITCHLHHKEGHTESTSLASPADPSGGKNDIQAIGSTVTYLKRYTFCAVLGITTADEDDDGAGYPPKKEPPVGLIADMKMMKHACYGILTGPLFTDKDREAFKKRTRKTTKDWEEEYHNLLIMKATKEMNKKKNESAGPLPFPEVEDAEIIPENKKPVQSKMGEMFGTK